jgi:hypothetical protein
MNTPGNCSAGKSGAAKITPRKRSRSLVKRLDPYRNRDLQCAKLDRAVRRLRRMSNLVYLFSRRWSCSGMLVLGIHHTHH